MKRRYGGSISVGDERTKLSLIERIMEDEAVEDWPQATVFSHPNFKRWDAYELDVYYKMHSINLDVRCSDDITHKRHGCIAASDGKARESTYSTWEFIYSKS